MDKDNKMTKEQHISTLDEVIASSGYLLDCLILLRRITNLPTCNECAKTKYCEYCPKPGESVRYNCPHFVGGEASE